MTGEFYAVIMAGGGGTRLWPISRRSRPKQALRLLGDRTLFQMAVDRLRPMFAPENVLVVTVAEQAETLRKQVPELSEACFLIEPEPRGTASVIGMAAAVLERRSPECVMACLTADHYISDAACFRRVLQAAHALASEGDLVTLGIKPTHPATGYGYIHRGEERGTFGGYAAYRVKAFEEKPILERAEAYLASGQYSWNSGMFVWKALRVLEEIERQMPALYGALQLMAGSVGAADEAASIDRIWRELQSQTIDYGVMEGARNVSVIPADDLGWSDIGGWEGLFELSQSDAQGNLVMGAQAHLVDTKDTLVFRGEGAEARLIATLGVEGLIIVDSGDVLFVCPRERVEEVRRLVAGLPGAGLEDYT